jgi:DNA-binding transcriptional MocR family regulator
MTPDRAATARRPAGHTRATRQALAAYLQTHRDASHRAIARALGVSASTVDRACRQLRQATRSECAHGHTVTHPADAPAAPLADAVTQHRDAPSMTRPRCPCCAWRQMQPVPAGSLAHCEQCGHGWRVPEAEEASR